MQKWANLSLLGKVRQIKEFVSTRRFRTLRLSYPFFFVFFLFYVFSLLMPACVYISIAMLSLLFPLHTSPDPPSFFFRISFTVFFSFFFSLSPSLSFYSEVWPYKFLYAVLHTRVTHTRGASDENLQYP